MDGTQWIIKLIANGHEIIMQIGKRVPNLHNIDMGQISIWATLTDIVMEWSLQLGLHWSLIKK